ncbi:TrmH family RNA methyltransferase [Pseudaquabacterium rugosum]|uniref:RNA methyltransferase n=1 Tax=Pseudaquabacterium rugosum TaxID=2984194 RepID=A0ABU9BED4_9BURK
MTAASIPSGAAPGQPDVQRLSSRDNPLLVQLRRLARDPAAYRKAGRVWLEGEHLCSALLTRGLRPLQAVITEAAWETGGALHDLARAAPQVRVLPAALFDGLSGLESPAPLGYVWALPEAGAIAPQAASLVLDRVQDAGNVGSMLRSAAAFGVGQVLALKGTAALWSPKVLRSGMGAHFGLRLIEGLAPEALQALAVPLIGTSLGDDSVALPLARVAQPCAWVMGHEGQGVDAALLARCAQRVRIPQPGGEESLNVAAATAICLYESVRQGAAD